MGGFGQAHQRVEFIERHALERFRTLRLIDHAPLLHDIRETIGHPCNGRFAVTPGASGFLIIGLDVLGQIEMRHEAHIGLIDPHAERHGGDDDDAVLVEETILIAGPQI